MTDWDARMSRPAELSENPSRDRFETLEHSPDREPDFSHLPKHGKGDPSLVEQGTLPAYSKRDEISSESALRWPALRSAQEAARDDSAVPAKEAPGDAAQPDTSEGEA